MTKKYQELEFTDNFMFSNTLYNNHELCKELLELILNIPISKIETVDPEKFIKTGNNSKGVRFDVYVKDEADTHFDIDMQVGDEPDLPKRSRYYHRMLDAHQLKRGQGYEDLKESYVIFICKSKLDIENDFPVYYYEYTCRDDSNIKLKDGSHIVFLNCCYEGKELSEELRDFFNYINTGKATGDNDNFAHRLENEVAINRLNEEWEAAYMTFEEIVQAEVRKAKAEGLREGIARGMEQGIEQGLEQGIAQEKTLTIKALLKKFQPEEVAELLEVSVDEVKAVI